MASVAILSPVQSAIHDVTGTRVLKSRVRTVQGKRIQSPTPRAVRNAYGIARWPIGLQEHAWAALPESGWVPGLNGEPSFPDKRPWTTDNQKRADRRRAGNDLRIQTLWMTEFGPEDTHPLEGFARKPDDRPDQKMASKVLNLSKHSIGEVLECLVKVKHHGYRVLPEKLPILQRRDLGKVLKETYPRMVRVIVN